MSFLDERPWPMQADGFEIDSEIVQTPDVVHCAQFFGIVSTSEMQGSAPSSTSRIRPDCYVRPAPRDATHTDPQILFSVVGP